MPGLESDFEEWQTQEVNVARGEDEGDIDLDIIAVHCSYPIRMHDFNCILDIVIPPVEIMHSDWITAMIYFLMSPSK